MKTKEEKGMTVEQYEQYDKERQEALKKYEEAAINKYKKTLEKGADGRLHKELRQYAEQTNYGIEINNELSQTKSTGLTKTDKNTRRIINIEEKTDKMINITKVKDLKSNHEDYNCLIKGNIFHTLVDCQKNPMLFKMPDALKDYNYIDAHGETEMTNTLKQNIIFCQSDTTQVEVYTDGESFSLTNVLPKNGIMLAEERITTVGKLKQMANVDYINNPNEYIAPSAFYLIGVSDIKMLPMLGKQITCNVGIGVHPLDCNTDVTNNPDFGANVLKEFGWTLEKGKYTYNKTFDELEKTDKEECLQYVEKEFPKLNGVSKTFKALERYTATKIDTISIEIYNCKLGLPQIITGFIV